MVLRNSGRVGSRRFFPSLRFSIESEAFLMPILFSCSLQNQELRLYSFLAKCKIVCLEILFSSDIGMDFLQFQMKLLSLCLFYSSGTDYLK